MSIATLIMAFARISSFIFFIPFLSGKNIHNTAKVVICLSLSFLVVHKVEEVVVTNVVQLVGMVIVQIVIGTTLALIVNFLLAIPKMAGSMMDMDLGFSQSNILDPSTGQSNTVIATILNLMFVLLFILLGGLHQLIYTFMKSFELTETLFFLQDARFFDYFVGVFMYAITAGVQIALPVMGAMFVLNFALMVVGKTTPQLQIFQNMFAIKITLGLLFIGIFVPVLANVFEILNQNIMDEYIRAFDYMFERKGE